MKSISASSRREAFIANIRNQESKMQMSRAIEVDNGEMIVKRVSVPIGLEELMEGLTREVIMKKPSDIYLFASQYFDRLLKLRQQGEYKGVTAKSAQCAFKQSMTGNISKIMEQKIAEAATATRSKTPGKQTYGAGDNNKTSVSDVKSTSKMPGDKVKIDGKQILDKRKARKIASENANQKDAVRNKWTSKEKVSPRVSKERKEITPRETPRRGRSTSRHGTTLNEEKADRKPQDTIKEMKPENQTPRVKTRRTPREKNEKNKEKVVSKSKSGSTISLDKDNESSAVIETSDENKKYSKTDVDKTSEKVTEKGKPKLSTVESTEQTPEQNKAAKVEESTDLVSLEKVKTKKPGAEAEKLSTQANKDTGNIKLENEEKLKEGSVQKGDLPFPPGHAATTRDDEINEGESQKSITKITEDGDEFSEKVAASETLSKNGKTITNFDDSDMQKVENSETLTSEPKKGHPAKTEAGEVEPNEDDEKSEKPDENEMKGTKIAKIDAEQKETLESKKGKLYAVPKSEGSIKGSKIYETSAVENEIHESKIEESPEEPETRKTAEENLKASDRQSESIVSQSNNTYLTKDLSKGTDTDNDLNVQEISEEDDSNKSIKHSEDTKELSIGHSSGEDNLQIIDTELEQQKEETNQEKIDKCINLKSTEVTTDSHKPDAEDQAKQKLPAVDLQKAEAALEKARDLSSLMTGNKEKIQLKTKQQVEKVTKDGMIRDSGKYKATSEDKKALLASGLVAATSVISARGHEGVQQTEPSLLQTSGVIETSPLKGVTNHNSVSKSAEQIAKIIDIDSKTDIEGLDSSKQQKNEIMEEVVVPSDAKSALTTDMKVDNDSEKDYQENVTTNGKTSELTVESSHSKDSPDKVEDISRSKGDTDSEESIKDVEGAKKTYDPSKTENDIEDVTKLADHSLELQDKRSDGNDSNADIDGNLDGSDVRESSNLDIEKSVLDGEDMKDTEDKASKYDPLKLRNEIQEAAEAAKKVEENAPSISDEIKPIADNQSKGTEDVIKDAFNYEKEEDTKNKYDPAKLRNEIEDSTKEEEFKRTELKDQHSGISPVMKEMPVMVEKQGDSKLDLKISDEELQKVEIPLKCEDGGKNETLVDSNITKPIIEEKSHEKSKNEDVSGSSNKTTADIDSSIGEKVLKRHDTPLNDQLILKHSEKTKSGNHEDDGHLETETTENELKKDIKEQMEGSLKVDSIKDDSDKEIKKISEAKHSADKDSAPIRQGSYGQKEVPLTKQEEPNFDKDSMSSNRGDDDGKVKSIGSSGDIQPEGREKLHEERDRSSQKDESKEAREQNIDASQNVKDETERDKSKIFGAINKQSIEESQEIDKTERDKSETVKKQDAEENQNMKDKIKRDKSKEGEAIEGQTIEETQNLLDGIEKPISASEGAESDVKTEADKLSKVDKELEKQNDSSSGTNEAEASKSLESPSKGEAMPATETKDGNAASKDGKLEDAIEANDAPDISTETSDHVDQGKSKDADDKKVISEINVKDEKQKGVDPTDISAHITEDTEQVNEEQEDKETDDSATGGINRTKSERHKELTDKSALKSFLQLEKEFAHQEIISSSSDINNTKGDGDLIQGDGHNEDESKPGATGLDENMKEKVEHTDKRDNIENMERIGNGNNNEIVKEEEAHKIKHVEDIKMKDNANIPAETDVEENQEDEKKVNSEMMNKSLGQDKERRENQKEAEDENQIKSADEINLKEYSSDLSSEGFSEDKSKLKTPDKTRTSVDNANSVIESDGVKEKLDLTNSGKGTPLSETGADLESSDDSKDKPESKTAAEKIKGLEEETLRKSASNEDRDKIMGMNTERMQKSTEDYSENRSEQDVEKDKIPSNLLFEDDNGSPPKESFDESVKTENGTTEESGKHYILKRNAQETERAVSDTTFTVESTPSFSERTTTDGEDATGVSLSLEESSQSKTASDKNELSKLSSKSVRSTQSDEALDVEKIEERNKSPPQSRDLEETALEEKQTPSENGKKSSKQRTLTEQSSFGDVIENGGFSNDYIDDATSQDVIEKNQALKTDVVVEEENQSSNDKKSALESVIEGDERLSSDENEKRLLLNKHDDTNVHPENLNFKREDATLSKIEDTKKSEEQGEENDVVETSKEAKLVEINKKEKDPDGKKQEKSDTSQDESTPSFSINQLKEEIKLVASAKDKGVESNEGSKLPIVLKQHGKVEDTSANVGDSLQDASVEVIKDHVKMEESSFSANEGDEATKLQKESGQTSDEVTVKDFKTNRGSMSSISDIQTDNLSSLAEQEEQHEVKGTEVFNEDHEKRSKSLLNTQIVEKENYQSAGVEEEGKRGELNEGDNEKQEISGTSDYLNNTQGVKDGPERHKSVENEFLEDEYQTSGKDDNRMDNRSREVFNVTPESGTVLDDQRHADGKTFVAADDSEKDPQFQTGLEVISHKEAKTWATVEDSKKNSDDKPLRENEDTKDTSNVEDATDEKNKGDLFSIDKLKEEIDLATKSSKAAYPKDQNNLTAGSGGSNAGEVKQVQENEEIYTKVTSKLEDESDKGNKKDDSFRIDKLKEEIDLAVKSSEVAAVKDHNNLTNDSEGSNAGEDIQVKEDEGIDSKDTSKVEDERDKDNKKDDLFSMNELKEEIDRAAKSSKVTVLKDENNLTSDSGESNAGKGKKDSLRSKRSTEEYEETFSSRPSKNEQILEEERNKDIKPVETGIRDENGSMGVEDIERRAQSDAGEDGKENNSSKIVGLDEEETSNAKTEPSIAKAVVPEVEISDAERSKSESGLAKRDIRTSKEDELIEQERIDDGKGKPYSTISNLKDETTPILEVQEEGHFSDEAINEEENRKPNEGETRISNNPKEMDLEKQIISIDDKHKSSSAKEDDMSGSQYKSNGEASKDNNEDGEGEDIMNDARRMSALFLEQEKSKNDVIKPDYIFISLHGNGDKSEDVIEEKDSTAKGRTSSLNVDGLGEETASADVSRSTENANSDLKSKFGEVENQRKDDFIQDKEKMKENTVPSLHTTDRESEQDEEMQDKSILKRGYLDENVEDVKGAKPEGVASKTDIEDVSSRKISSTEHDNSAKGEQRSLATVPETSGRISSETTQKSDVNVNEERDKIIENVLPDDKATSAGDKKSIKVTSSFSIDKLKEEISTASTEAGAESNRDVTYKEIIPGYNESDSKREDTISSKLKDEHVKSKKGKDEEKEALERAEIKGIGGIATHVEENRDSVVNIDKLKNETSAASREASKEANLIQGSFQEAILDHGNVATNNGVSEKDKGDTGKENTGEKEEEDVPEKEIDKQALEVDKTNSEKGVVSPFSIEKLKEELAIVASEAKDDLKLKNISQEEISDQSKLSSGTVDLIGDVVDDKALESKEEGKNGENIASTGQGDKADITASHKESVSMNAREVAEPTVPNETTQRPEHNKESQEEIADSGRLDDSTGIGISPDEKEESKEKEAKAGKDQENTGNEGEGEISKRNGTEKNTTPTFSIDKLKDEISATARRESKDPGDNEALKVDQSKVDTESEDKSSIKLTATELESKQESRKKEIPNREHETKALESATNDERNFKFSSDKLKPDISAISYEDNEESISGDRTKSEILKDNESGIDHEIPQDTNIELGKVETEGYKSGDPLETEEEKVLGINGFDGFNIRQLREEISAASEDTRKGSEVDGVSSKGHTETVETTEDEGLKKTLDEKQDEISLESKENNAEGKSSNIFELDKEETTSEASNQDVATSEESSGTNKVFGKNKDELHVHEGEVLEKDQGKEKKEREDILGAEKDEGKKRKESSDILESEEDEKTLKKDDYCTEKKTPGTFSTDKLNEEISAASSEPGEESDTSGVPKSVISDHDCDGNKARIIEKGETESKEDILEKKGEDRDAPETTVNDQKQQMGSFDIGKLREEIYGDVKSPESEMEESRSSSTEKNSKEEEREAKFDDTSKSNVEKYVSEQRDDIMKHQKNNTSKAEKPGNFKDSEEGIHERNEVQSTAEKRKNIVDAGKISGSVENDSMPDDEGKKGSTYKELRKPSKDEEGKDCAKEVRERKLQQQSTFDIEKLHQEIYEYSFDNGEKVAEQSEAEMNVKSDEMITPDDAEKERVNERGKRSVEGADNAEGKTGSKRSSQEGPKDGMELLRNEKIITNLISDQDEGIKSYTNGKEGSSKLHSQDMTGEIRTNAKDSELDSIKDKLSRAESEDGTKKAESKESQKDITLDVAAKAEEITDDILLEAAKEAKSLHASFDGSKKLPTDIQESHLVVANDGSSNESDEKDTKEILRQTNEPNQETESSISDKFQKHTKNDVSENTAEEFDKKDHQDNINDSLSRDHVASGVKIDGDIESLGRQIKDKIVDSGAPKKEEIEKNKEGLKETSTRSESDAKIETRKSSGKEKDHVGESPTLQELQPDTTERTIAKTSDGKEESKENAEETQAVSDSGRLHREIVNATSTGLTSSAMKQIGKDNAVREELEAVDESGRKAIHIAKDFEKRQGREERVTHDRMSESSFDADNLHEEIEKATPDRISQASSEQRIEEPSGESVNENEVKREVDDMSGSKHVEIKKESEDDSLNYMNSKASSGLSEELATGHDDSASHSNELNREMALSKRNDEQLVAEKENLEGSNTETSDIKASEDDTTKKSSGTDGKTRTSSVHFSERVEHIPREEVELENEESDQDITHELKNDSQEANGIEKMEDDELSEVENEENQSENIASKGYLAVDELDAKKRNESLATRPEQEKRSLQLATGTSRNALLTALGTRTDTSPKSNEKEIKSKETDVSKFDAKTSKKGIEDLLAHEKEHSTKLMPAFTGQALTRSENGRVIKKRPSKENMKEQKREDPKRELKKSKSLQQETFIKVKGLTLEEPKKANLKKKSSSLDETTKDKKQETRIKLQAQASASKIPVKENIKLTNTRRRSTSQDALIKPSTQVKVPEAKDAKNLKRIKSVDGGLRAKNKSAMKPETQQRNGSQKLKQKDLVSKSLATTQAIATNELTGEETDTNTSEKDNNGTGGKDLDDEVTSQIGVTESKKFETDDSDKSQNDAIKGEEQKLKYFENTNKEDSQNETDIDQQGISGATTDRNTDEEDTKHSKPQSAPDTARSSDKDQKTHDSDDHGNVPKKGEEICHIYHSSQGNKFAPNASDFLFKAKAASKIQSFWRKFLKDKVEGTTNGSSLGDKGVVDENQNIIGISDHENIKEEENIAEDKTKSEKAVIASTPSDEANKEDIEYIPKDKSETEIDKDPTKDQMNGPKSRDHPDFFKAASQIQAFWRGFQVRKHRQRGQLFGTNVREDDKANEVLKDVKLTNDQAANSALMIQRIWRGYNVRKNIKDVKKKLAVLEQDSDQKGPTDRDIYRAASKIQAAVRGYMIRKNMEKPQTLLSISEESSTKGNSEVHTPVKNITHDDEKIGHDDKIMDALKQLDNIKVPTHIPISSPKTEKRHQLEKCVTVEEPECKKKTFALINKAHSTSDINCHVVGIGKKVENDESKTEEVISAKDDDESKKEMENNANNARQILEESTDISKDVKKQPDKTPTEVTSVRVDAIEGTEIQREQNQNNEMTEDKKLHPGDRISTFHSQLDERNEDTDRIDVAKSKKISREDSLINKLDSDGKNNDENIFATRGDNLLSKQVDTESNKILPHSENNIAEKAMENKQNAIIAHDVNDEATAVPNNIADTFPRNEAFRLKSSLTHDQASCGDSSMQIDNCDVAGNKINKDLTKTIIEGKPLDLISGNKVEDSQTVSQNSGSKQINPSNEEYLEKKDSESIQSDKKLEKEGVENKYASETELSGNKQNCEAEDSQNGSQDSGSKRLDGSREEDLEKKNSELIQNDEKLENGGEESELGSRIESFGNKQICETVDLQNGSKQEDRSNEKGFEKKDSESIESDKKLEKGVEEGKLGSEMELSNNNQFCESQDSQNGLQNSGSKQEDRLSEKGLEKKDSKSIEIDEKLEEGGEESKLGSEIELSKNSQFCEFEDSQNRLQNSGSKQEDRSSKKYLEENDSGSIESDKKLEKGGKESKLRSEIELSSNKQICEAEDTQNGSKDSGFKQMTLTSKKNLKPEISVSTEDEGHDSKKEEHQNKLDSVVTLSRSLSEKSTSDELSPQKISRGPSVSSSASSDSASTVVFVPKEDEHEELESLEKKQSESEEHASTNKETDTVENASMKEEQLDSVTRERSECENTAENSKEGTNGSDIDKLHEEIEKFSSDKDDNDNSSMRHSNIKEEINEKSGQREEKSGNTKGQVIIIDHDEGMKPGKAIEEYDKRERHESLVKDNAPDEVERSEATKETSDMTHLKEDENEEITKEKGTKMYHSSTSATKGKDEISEAEAATKIQSAFRGYRVRRGLDIINNVDEGDLSKFVANRELTDIKEEDSNGRNSASPIDMSRPFLKIDVVTTNNDKAESTTPEPKGKQSHSGSPKTEDGTHRVHLVGDSVTVPIVISRAPTPSRELNDSTVTAEVQMDHGDQNQTTTTTTDGSSVPVQVQLNEAPGQVFVIIVSGFHQFHYADVDPLLEKAPYFP